MSRRQARVTMLAMGLLMTSSTLGFLSTFSDPSPIFGTSRQPALRVAFAVVFVLAVSLFIFVAVSIRRGNND